jgi:thioredoxin-related protein
MNEFVLAVTNNRPSYPSIAYLDEQGNVLTVVPGYQKPESLHPILQFLKEDKFKTMKFEEFVSSQQPTSK